MGPTAAVCNRNLGVAMATAAPRTHSTRLRFIATTLEIPFLNSHCPQRFLTHRIRSSRGTIDNNLIPRSLGGGIRTALATLLVALGNRIADRWKEFHRELMFFGSPHAS